MNVLARAAELDVIIVDVGVDGHLDHSAGLLDRKIRNGTRNFVVAPAMTEPEVFAALEVGFEQGREAADARRNLVVPGDMGIGNTTAASAITAAFTGAAASKITGAGTGLSAQGMAAKAALIERSLDRHFGKRRGADLTPLDVLRSVGGLEIAAMTGLILKAASERMLVVLDGFISTAASALAYALAPAVKPFLFAGHQSGEVGHEALLRYLGLEPLLKLEMRLGEGTGAILATQLIRSALRLYNEMATFEAAQVSGATA